MNLIVPITQIRYTLVPCESTDSKYTVWMDSDGRYGSDVWTESESVVKKK